MPSMMLSWLTSTAPTCKGALRSCMWTWSVPYHVPSAHARPTDLFVGVFRPLSAEERQCDEVVVPGQVAVQHSTTTVSSHAEVSSHLQDCFTSRCGTHCLRGRGSKGSAGRCRRCGTAMRQLHEDWEPLVLPIVAARCRNQAAVIAAAAIAETLAVATRTNPEVCRSTMQSWVKARSLSLTRLRLPRILRVSTWLMRVHQCAHGLVRFGGEPEHACTQFARLLTCLCGYRSTAVCSIKEHVRRRPTRVASTASWKWPLHPNSNAVPLTQ